MRLTNVCIIIIIIIITIIMLVYKCVHGLAPSYLVAFCQATSDHPGRSSLRSANLYQLHVPRTRTNLGDGIFSVNGPVVWNSLSGDLRTPDILLNVFKWLPYLKRSYSRLSVDGAFAA